jgi:hypothetical protein
MMNGETPEGGSPTVESVEAEQPHLKFYPIEVLSEKRRPNAPEVVVLVDQFDDYLEIKPRYAMRELKRFGPPTLKAPFEWSVPVKKLPRHPHYTWHRVAPIPGDRGIPSVPVFRVYAANQFTESSLEFFEIAGASALLVPAGKTHDGKSYENPDGTTHFKVYKISLPEVKQGEYRLTDQFTVTLDKYGVGHAVKTPKFFAVPCDKNDEQRSGDAHLLIYELDRSESLYRPQKFQAGDQFGAYDLSLFTPDLLAVPTVKLRFSRIK